jgi:hypothetical protein
MLLLVPLKRKNFQYLFYFIHFKKYHHYHVEYSMFSGVILLSHNTVKELC